MVEKLTMKQEVFYDGMEKAILNKKFALYDPDTFDRGTGKTTVVNEIGFTYQALGYNVYVLSPCRNLEYYACKMIDKIEDLRGIKINNLIILVDEELKELKSYKIIESFCKHLNIPMVGFVRNKVTNLDDDLSMNDYNKMEFNYQY